MVELYQGEGGQARISSCSSVATWRSQCSGGHRLDEQHPVWSSDSISDESLIKPLRSLDSAARSTFSISFSCILFGLYFHGDHEALQGSGSPPLVFAVERKEGWNTSWINWISQIPSWRNCFKTCSLQLKLLMDSNCCTCVALVAKYKHMPEFPLFSPLLFLLSFLFVIFSSLAFKYKSWETASNILLGILSKATKISCSN